MATLKCNKLFLTLYDKSKEQVVISKITSKYQTTIPKKIRNKLKLNIADTLEWKIENDKVVVFPSGKEFLKYKAFINVEPGNTKDDIKKARETIAEKYK